MTTLRDIWIQRGMTSTDVASKAGISVPTLYRANRKERVYNKNLKDICRVLGITLTEYNALEVCPMAERYQKGE